jgi:hypothetical protein
MKITKLSTLLIGALLTGLVSCEYQTVVPNDVVIPPTPIDFATEIAPIFTDLNCIQCHNGTFKFSLAPDKAYQSIMDNNLVDTLNPANSILMVTINSGHNTAANMTAEQKALILEWITQGAKGEVTPVSFSNEVEPIFAGAGCTSCHGGSLAPDLRSGKAYASLTSNNLVVANDVAGSKLIQYINAGHNTSSQITAAQKSLIETWINQGIQNN